MVKSTHSGTRNVPLKLAEAITAIVNAKWENGEFLDKVTPVTKDLLRFWDPKGSFADLRNSNFHRGQWQSILNSIYIHEVMKLKNVQDIYMTIEPQLLQEMDLLDMQKTSICTQNTALKWQQGQERHGSCMLYLSGNILMQNMKKQH